MKKFLLVNFMLLGMVSFVWAQQNISGQIVGEDGSGLPGVNVVVKGTTTGTISDFDGNYRLAVDQGATTLVYTYIGYSTQEVEIGSRSVIDVTLSVDVTELQEIVVSGSAVGQSKKTLSFAVGDISEEQIQSVPQPNIGNSLQGKVAGVRVTSVGGQPGAGLAILTRSANSISNGQQPLIIMDGVFLANTTLADINAEDIVKIEVLKGAAGASLYGSQAANGVIQIFTRRGTGAATGTSVTVRSEVGVATLANSFPIARTHHFELDDTGNFVLDANGGLRIDSDQIGDNPFPGFQNYEDVIFRDGVFNTNYISVAHRGEETSFMISAQRFKDEGIVSYNDGYNRNSFRLNVDHRLSDKLDIGISSAYSRSEQDFLTENGTNAPFNSLLFLPPIYDVENSVNDEDGSQFDWDIDTLASLIRNPLYDLNNREQTVIRNRLMGSMKVNYDITDWLGVDGSISLDRSDNEYEDFAVKGFLSDNIRAGIQKTASQPGGGIERTTNIQNYLTGRLNATVQKSINDFNLAFRLGFLYEDFTQEYNGVQGDGLAVNDIRSLDNLVTNITVESESQEITANSFFGIFDGNYQEKYIFSALFRREGSSLFGPEERWGSYFRLSGAYRLTEDFDIPGVQELKLRASLGTAGLRPTFEQRFETFTLRAGSSSKNTLGNVFLKPATSTEIELGLDASFLNRFNLEFNWVSNETEDQILNVPLSGAAGFSGQWRNAGTIDAETIELSLGANIMNTNDFRWDVNVVFDRTTQTVDKLNVPAYNTGPGNQQSRIFRVEEGVSFGSIYGESFAKSVDELAGQETDLSQFEVNDIGWVVRRDQRGTVNESPIKILDAAGNPLVGKIGDINPDFRMGFSTTLNYKGIGLFALLDWKKGGDIYNQSRQWLFRDLLHSDIAKYPVSTTFWNNLYNVNVGNNAFTEDGSYAMLRELALSYTIGPDMLDGLFGGFVKEVKLGFVARNLFTITDYSGFHPDITSVPRNENTLTNRDQNGVGSNANTPNGDPNLFIFDAFVYPKTKTFTGTVAFKF